MQRNVGSLDKSIRIVIALIIFGVGYYYQSWWGLIGLIPLVTALVGWCPAYRLLGISSCPASRETTAH